MALEQAPIQFPWQMFLQAQAMKNQNQGYMYGDIEGIGSGFGKIGKELEQQQAAAALQKALATMRYQQGQPDQLPMQGPMQPQQMPAGMAGPAAPEAQRPMLSNPQTPPDISGPLRTLYPEQFGKSMMNSVDPLVRSEIYKNMRTGDNHIQYGKDAANAVLSGDVNAFSKLTNGMPIDQQTLNLMSTAKGREGINSRSMQFLEQRRDRAILDYTEALEKNPLLVKAREQGLGLDQVNILIATVKSGNSVAAAGMGIKMAKAMGEVGVLTENDVRRYVKSGKLTQAAADKLTGWLRGIPSEATIGEIEQISAAMQGSFDTKIQSIYDRYVRRLSENYEMTPEQAARRMDVPYSGLTGVKAAAPTNGAAAPDRLSVSGFSVTP